MLLSRPHILYKEVIMKVKGGDSNQKFQNNFFKQQIKSKGIDKSPHQTGQKRSDFWSKPNLTPVEPNQVNEVMAINAFVLMAQLSG